MKRISTAILVLAASVTAVVPASAQEPESQTFEFNSVENHGEFEHCVVTVSPSPEDPTVLVPSDETCFRDPGQARTLAESGGAGVGTRSIFSNGLIAIHHDGPNFTGASLAISGANCSGGGITFTGGAWDDRISSTENGCSNVEHWETSAPFSFTGRMEQTTGFGGNLNVLSNEVSGVLYKGSRCALGSRWSNAWRPR